MENLKDTELVYRAANLMRENRELKDKLKDLTLQNENAAKEIERLENILARIPSDSLPKDVDINFGPHALRFKMVTVMYFDIHGFKSLTADGRTGNVIDILDQILFHFNDIAEKYNLQIIKTVGDAYMCTGGIPVKNITNPIDVVLAALEMNDYLVNLKKEFTKNSQKFWEHKIGIHTGPVSATPTGRKKISYDIKGETVNIAARMASAADVGKINVSVYTYELVKEYFITEFNGITPVKYEGYLEMYYIKRLKRPLSVNPDLGAYPNHLFQVKYLLRQFTDLQEVILDKLEKELPSFVRYHNYKHTIDVVNQAELIGYGEGVDDEDILLLKTAALFHDTGQTISFDKHEYFSSRIAREILPNWKYTTQQIELVCKIIIATELPPHPQNILEKIICDADLDYLGRADFIPVSNALYEELKQQGKNIDINTWNKNQVKFLSDHQYFTDTARSLREIGKEKQIERIKQLIVDNQTSVDDSSLKSSSVDSVVKNLK